MPLSLPEKISLEKSLIYVLIVAVLIAFVFIFYLFFSYFTRDISVETPIGEEEWEIGKTYTIKWEANGIDKVGIVLFKGVEPKWIAKNVHAGQETYDWKIYPGQEFGDDYWIAVFEYPWKKGNQIAYSKGSFAITYPELASCDILSIEKEWPYVPSDLPDLRRVFITLGEYKGDLGGLDGADQICKKEAEEQGLEGVWHAFIGGEADDQMAVKRLEQTPRGKSGVYIEALPTATLIRGSTCHQLLGNNFSQFLNRFTDLSVVNSGKLSQEFLDSLSNVWLGRLNEKSKKNCSDIAAVIDNNQVAVAEKYTFTTTCQNWSIDERKIEGYSSLGDSSAFPTCYTPEGQSTKAVILGGLSTGFDGEGVNKTFTGYQGKYCDRSQRLVCIEE